MCDQLGPLITWWSSDYSSPRLQDLVDSLKSHVLPKVLRKLFPHECRWSNILLKDRTHARILARKCYVWVHNLKWSFQVKRVPCEQWTPTLTTVLSKQRMWQGLVGRAYNCAALEARARTLPRMLTQSYRASPSPAWASRRGPCLKKKQNFEWLNCL